MAHQIETQDSARRPRHRTGWRGAAAVALVLAAAGCRGTLYELPSPPPPSERHSVSLIPGEEQRADEKLYLAARASVLELYNLLSTQRYREAAQLMSVETRDFLMHGGKGKSVAEVLGGGKLQMPDGEVVDLDPVPMLLAADVSKLTDTVAGVEEHETQARKEIFAHLPSGKVQRIVMIKERGKWVLHRTRLSTPFSPPDK